MFKSETKIINELIKKKYPSMHALFSKHFSKIFKIEVARQNNAQ